MLTKTEFKEAFREAMEIQLASDLKESEPHEFTPGFEARMEEIIKTGKPNNKKKGLSRRGKRILIIAIAAVVALTLTACAVPEIRESIAGFFVKIFSDHVEYSDPDVTKERIEEEYGLVPIPEGFVEVKCLRGKDFVGTDYLDSDENCISLLQKANSHLNDTVDNERGSFYECTINGNTVRIYLSADSAQASWIANGYYFSLIYSSHVEQRQFEDLIASVNKK